MLRALIACMLCVSLAYADDRAAAERAFRTADRAYKAQNFEAAAHHYEEAYKHLPLPQIAFSAAQAYRKRYRVDPKIEYVQRAIALYEIYLAAVKSGGRVGDAADNLGEMKIELAQLQARGAALAPPPTPPARTRLAISPDVDIARDVALREVSEQRDEAAFKVTIDGRQVAAFQPIEVTPGLHEVRVEAPGFAPSTTTERAIEGVSTVAEIRLLPLPGTVTLATEPGARVLVDGRSRGVAPVAPFELPAGRHVLAIIRRGRAPIARDITVARGGELAVDAPLEPTTQRRSVRWVALGAGALAVFSAGSLVYAGVQHARAEDKRETIDKGDGSIGLANDYDAAIRSRDRWSTVAWVTGGAALATGLTALALYWFDMPDAESVQLAPTAGGVSLRGRF